MKLKKLYKIGSDFEFKAGPLQLSWLELPNGVQWSLVQILVVLTS